jgi:ATP-dependent DNA helicase HFM1/MER3
MPNRSNVSKRRTETVKASRKPSATSEDFGDDDIDDDALVKASIGDFENNHIDNYPDPTDSVARKNAPKNKSVRDKGNAKSKATSQSAVAMVDDDQEPVQLANGKWACNHACKDRDSCKHLCCKNGMDKPPKKKSVTKRVPSGEDRSQPQPTPAAKKGKETQSKLQLTASKRKISAPIEELDLTQEEKKRKADYATNGPRDYRSLHQLHKNIQGNGAPPSVHSVMHKKPTYCYSQGGEHHFKFMDPPVTQRSQTSSDYGDLPFEDLPVHLEQAQFHEQQDLAHISGHLESEGFMDYQATAPVASRGSDLFADDDSLLEDAMVGLADSQNMQGPDYSNESATQPVNNAMDYEYEFDYEDYNLPMDIEFTKLENTTHDASEGELAIPDNAPTPNPTVKKIKKPPFFDSSSSSHPRRVSPDPAKTASKCHDMKEMKQQGFASLNDSLTLNQWPKTLSKPPAAGEVDEFDVLGLFDDEPVNDVPPNEKPVPEAFKDLEPWLFKEFGDIVELVDE